MKRLSILLLTFTLLIGGTFAYFNNTTTLTARGSAGSVEIELDNKIDLYSADEYDILAPGDARSAEFELINKGNKSIDVRTTIALTVNSDTCDLSFTGDSTTQSEYDLYKKDDIEWVDGYGYVPKEGAKPVSVKTVEGNVIYYAVEEYSLNGNSELYSEVETVNRTGSFKHLYDYVLLLKSDIHEDWQSSYVTIDIVVEAKQHENTQAGWDIVKKETITQGSITTEAVASHG